MGGGLMNNPNLIHVIRQNFDILLNEYIGVNSENLIRIASLPKYNALLGGAIMHFNEHV